MSEIKKKKYTKPRLRIIELVADEVLAIGCKMAQANGPIGKHNCMASQCFHMGS